MWLVFACASALFAGVTSILAKIGIKDVDSNLATALRTAVVALFAWLMVMVAGSINTLGSIGPRSLLFLVLSGCATGGSWLCYFRALQIGNINKVVPVDKSSTVLTMLLAFLFLGEGLTWLKAGCMVLIAAGTFLMIERRDVAPLKSEGGGWFFYAALSALFASLTAILGKIGIEGVESNLGTAIRTLVVLVMAWAIVFIQNKQSGIAAIDRRSWLFLGLSGLATGLSWLCYYRALQIGPASVVVPIDKLSILITTLFGYLVFGERLSRRSAPGLLCIAAGTITMVFA